MTCTRNVALVVAVCLAVVVAVVADQPRSDLSMSQSTSTPQRHHHPMQKKNEQVGAARSLLSTRMGQEQVRALARFFDIRLDPNHDGRCDKDEYHRYMTWMDPEDMPSVPFESIADRWMELDLDGSGYLTVDELCVGLKLCAPQDVRRATGAGGLQSEHPPLSAVLYAGETTLPQQVHLAMGESYDTVIVSWAQEGAVSGEVFVQYGPESGQYHYQHPASTHTYTVSQSGLSYTSMPLADANMTNLKASSSVFYRVGNEDLGWSEEFFFVSMPDTQHPTLDSISRWIVLGDMGTSIPMGASVCKYIEAQMEETPYNLTLHVGDLAYAGVNSHGEWEPTWDSWMSQISPIASKMPYMVSNGNHENYFNYSSLLNRFTMPSASSHGNHMFWYSFEYANIHVTSFSTEHPFTVGSEQWEWIRQDLDRASRDPLIDWIILAGHRPLYSSDEDRYDAHRPGCPFLQALEPLIKTYSVDLVLTGHEHCYERTMPVMNGTVVGGNPSSEPLCSTPLANEIATNQTMQVWKDLEGAPIYVVQGTAGAAQWDSFVNPQPAWSYYRTEDTYIYGFGQLLLATTPEGCTSILYQFVGRESRDIIDQFMLQKQAKQMRGKERIALS